MYADNFTAQKLLPLANKYVRNLNFIFALLQELSLLARAILMSAESRGCLLKDILSAVVSTIASRCQFNWKVKHFLHLNEINRTSKAVRIP